MFKSTLVYIQIKRNQVTVVNLETGLEVTRDAIRPFSTHRVVIGSFNPANETVLAAMRALGIKRRFGALKAVIQQLEGTEVGLSDIERRALRDLAEMAGASKVYLAEKEGKLTNDQAIALIEGRKS